MKKQQMKERERARDFASRVIREKIVSLELAPGSQISETELAEQLGISRTPIREALIDLHKVRIIDIMPQKGIAISLIDYDMVDEAQFIRFTLECAVVDALCATGLTPQQEAAFVENLQLQEFYLQNPISNRLFELDNHFHQMLFQFAQREMAYQLTESMNVHFDRVRSMSTHADEGHDASLVAEHWEILEGILQKDRERAHECLVKHLARYKYDAQYIKAHYAGYIKESTPS